MARFKGSLEKGKVIMPPKEVKLDDDPTTYRRDLVYRYISSHTGKQIQEIDELENLLTLLKGHFDNDIYKKLETGKQLSKEELAYFKLIKEILIDLHKAKHGETKVNVTVGYDNIREMMFGKDSEGSK